QISKKDRKNPPPTKNFFLTNHQPPLKLRGFSWNHIQSLRGLRHSILFLGDTPADLPTGHLRSETGTSNTRMIFNSPSPHRTRCRCRNIDLLPIDYDFRPRLRGRLTLLR